MIDEQTRKAVLEMQKERLGSRAIARALQLPRSTVRRILTSQEVTCPTIERDSTLTGHLDRIRDLFVKCEGNRVRVLEELAKEINEKISYSTLTRFCRQHRIGGPKEGPDPAGHYEFGPGEESQHDTSPVSILVGTNNRVYQAAVTKYAFSTARFLQFYRRFRRFHCKHFLAETFDFLEGVCGRCVIDNTSVVIARGTGANAIVAPEMKAFEKRYGFEFLAHEKGDANRKARVEREIRFVQDNFLKGRTFKSDRDLNEQARQWCRKQNSTKNRRRQAIPNDLLLVERAHMKPVPSHLPPAHEIHQRRRVDVHGFVTLHTNCYSAPRDTIGREVTLRETMHEVTILDGPRVLCVHPRYPEGERNLSRLEGHRWGRERRRWDKDAKQPEEIWLQKRSPSFQSFLAELKRQVGRRYPYQVRKLYGLCHDYGDQVLVQAVERSVSYGLYDVSRLERMLLKEHGTRLFQLKHERESAPEEGRVTALTVSESSEPIESEFVEVPSSKEDES